MPATPQKKAPTISNLTTSPPRISHRKERARIDVLFHNMRITLSEVTRSRTRHQQYPGPRLELISLPDDVPCLWETTVHRPPQRNGNWIVKPLGVCWLVDEQPQGRKSFDGAPARCHSRKTAHLGLTKSSRPRSVQDLTSRMEASMEAMAFPVVGRGCGSTRQIRIMALQKRYIVVRNFRTASADALLAYHASHSESYKAESDKHFASLFIGYTS